MKLKINSTPEGVIVRNQNFDKIGKTPFEIEKDEFLGQRLFLNYDGIIKEIVVDETLVDINESFLKTIEDNDLSSTNVELLNSDEVEENSSLNFKFILGCIAVIVVLIGVVYWYFSSKPNEVVTPSNMDVVKVDSLPKPDLENSVEFSDKSNSTQNIIKESNVTTKEKVISSSGNIELSKNKILQDNSNEINSNLSKEKENDKKIINEDNFSIPELLTLNTISTVPIYHGCQSEAEISNSEGIRCFSKKLSLAIEEELTTFSNNEELQNVTKAEVKLSFTVDDKGNIEGNSFVGDRILGNECLKALKRISLRQKRNGNMIIPAKSKFGKPGIIKLTIPVRYETI